MSLSEKLTPRQLKACNNRLKGMDKKQAMLDAGYTKASAQSSYKFFEQPVVKEYLDYRMNNMVERNQVSEDWIIQRLYQIAAANPGDLLEFDAEGKTFINWKKLTPEMRAAIGGLEQHEYLEGRGPQAVPVRKLKMKERDALRALDMLARIHGMYNDKVEVTGEMSLVNRLQRGRERLVASDD